MKKLFEKIKKDAEERVLRNNDGNEDFLLYLDHKVMKKGEIIDIITEQIKFERSTYVVFVDDEPGKNFGHRCHYLLYDAESGEFIKKIPARFPYFLTKTPKTLELIRSCSTIERYKRKKKIRVKLDPAKLSAYLKLAPFPLKFYIRGRRYAILFSGASNGRHVNDLEFLYRTLVDVYGYDPADIYILNYDGTLNYNQLPWESAPSDGFAPDGSPWRMDLDSRIVGQGTRTDFQKVIDDLRSRIQRWDCLLIHTNNHGGYDYNKNDGFLCAFGDSRFYATDFAADLATLPKFNTLLVVMEQCHAGSFSQPIMNNSPATNTVFQAAVPWNEGSAGGWPFDPWIEMWISAMAGVHGDGSPLAISPDDNLDSLISAWEAYDYALSIDNPVMSESSPNISENIFLCRCLTIKPVKEIKEVKEFKEPKEEKEIKEPKEFKEVKEFKEPKEIKEVKEQKEIKEIKEPKDIKEYEPKRVKELKEPKEVVEGPEISLYEPYHTQYVELDKRIERLEQIVNKLTPFIRSEERPELKPKISNKNKKK